MKHRFDPRKRTTIANLSETHAPLTAAELRLVTGGGARQVGGPLLGGGLSTGGGGCIDRTQLLTLASTTGTSDPFDVADD
jgi:hypothetical protein